jgi:hypothetical protein
MIRPEERQTQRHKDTTTERTKGSKNERHYDIGFFAKTNKTYKENEIKSERNTERHKE